MNQNHKITSFIFGVALSVFLDIFFWPSKIMNYEIFMMFLFIFNSIKIFIREFKYWNWSYFINWVKLKCIFITKFGVQAMWYFYNEILTWEFFFSDHWTRNNLNWCMLKSLLGKLKNYLFFSVGFRIYQKSRWRK